MEDRTKKTFSEAEIKKFKAMAGLVIDGDAKKKRKVDDAARLSIAQAKKAMPDADDDTLITFFSSIAFLLAHLASVQVKSIMDVIDATFDSYAVAAAHLVGAYDIEGDEVPKSEFKPGSRTAPVNIPADDSNTGLYL